MPSQSDLGMLLHVFIENKFDKNKTQDLKKEWVRKGKVELKYRWCPKNE